MRLDERVAIVTGGGVSIGKAYSLGLAREGAKVVIADINAEGGAVTAQEIKDNGGEAISVPTDVADQASTEAMAKAALDAYGRIDILVNNAAWFATLPLRDLEEIDVDEWDKVMAINLRGPFLCVRAVVPEMKQRQWGRIINISSSSVMGGNPRRIHYVTSKMGIIGFSRSLAGALGDDNILVNSILPGGTMDESTLAAYGREFYERPQTKPLKRIQVPEDLVGTVIFLSSDDSAFITGQAIVVDGGASKY